MFNQNNYMKVIEQYDGCEVSSIGIPIIDLNGLKHINDSFLQPFPLSPSARVVGGRRRLSKARLMQFYRLAKSSCVGPLRVIAQRPLYDPSAIIYLCLDEGLCHPKRACVIRCQKHLRLAKRHIIERIADIKIPDERSKPFEKLEWAGGKKA